MCFLKDMVLQNRQFNYTASFVDFCMHRRRFPTFSDVFCAFDSVF